jgi:outer membrane receptor protein involved in Fe transport
MTMEAHYQGAVNRRESDCQTLSYLQLRPDDVDAWISLDTNVGYPLNENIQISLKGTNILDSENYLVKNFDYPFDYKTMGRRVLLSLLIKI